MGPFILNDGGYADAVFCLGRVLILSLIVSSEALLARHKRVNFEKHLILFSTFAFLAVAETFGVFLGISAQREDLPAPAAWWVWYPILSAVGLFGIAFCFDFVRVRLMSEGARFFERKIRHYSSRFLLSAGTILALGAVLTREDYDFGNIPTSVYQMGRAAYLVHSVQALAFVVLVWKTLVTYGIWLSRSESRVLLGACLLGAAGAVVQMYTGPREVFTTIAYTLMVAVFLRDNYRRSEMEAVRASEERTASALLFHRVTTQLKSTSDLPQLYEITMDSLLGNLAAESGAIYLTEKQGQNLLPALVQGPYPPPMPIEENIDNSEMRQFIEQKPVPVGEGVVGQVVATGIPLYVYDERQGAAHYHWNTGEVGIRTTIALPLRSPDGIFGVVQVVNRLDGAPFSEENLRFMSLIVEQAGLSIYNARLHAEILQQQRAEEQLRVAREIQLRLIPSTLPNIPGITLSAEYFAAQEVGGDYYNFYRIDHDHLGFVVFDVAGKGVPGALLMAVTSTFMKMATARSNSPAWVLNEVNAALSVEKHKGLYVTAIYGVLRLSTLQLTLVSAGHPDALVIRDRDLSCERHKPHGAALGLLRPNKFRAVMEQETIQLDEGDTLLLYTDGVIEAMNVDGEQFGEERLCEVAKEYSRAGAKKMTSEVAKAVAEFAGNAPQYDDITLVAIRIAPDPTEPARELS